MGREKRWKVKVIGFSFSSCPTIRIGQEAIGMRSKIYLYVSFLFPCHAAIQSTLANDWKGQNLSLVLLPQGRIFLKNFMIIDFFVSLYFWTNCKAYLSSTFAELALSRTFGKKIPHKIADRLNVPTRPKAWESLPLSCQNWVLLIVRYAQLFK